MSPYRWALLLGAFLSTPQALGAEPRPAGRTGQAARPPGVLAGIDVLIRRDFAPLRGKRVGLITNPSGVARDGRATIDVLAAAPGVKLVALYAPEHGIRGSVKAGQRVRSGRDPRTGLPVHSLYGKTRRPTAAMLRGVDVLVFDLQEIGSRSYTFISTLGLSMAAAGARKIPFVVLDRPNLLGGHRVEGNIPSPRFRSFVGQYPIPYCHGLTVGELARMIRGRGWLPDAARCRLTVIPMEGYRRAMRWEETGLRWAQPSPNIPHPYTAFYTAATGIAGELNTLSIGVGADFPFELAGAPGLDPSALSAELNDRRLPGVLFEPATWRPRSHLFAGRECRGVRLRLRDLDGADLTRLNFEIMDAARKRAPGRSWLGRSAARARMFDLVCGTDRVRRMLLAGAKAARIWEEWNAGSAAFRTQRQPYLMYD